MVLSRLTAHAAHAAHGHHRHPTVPAGCVRLGGPRSGRLLAERRRAGAFLRGGGLADNAILAAHTRLVTQSTDPGLPERVLTGRVRASESRRRYRGYA